MNFKFEDDIFLEGSTLLLRPMKLADIEDLLPIAISCPKLLQFSPKQIYTKELLIAYVEAAIALRESRQRYTFTIVDKSNNSLVGSTAFLNVSNADDRLEIGATWIDKKYQGTGLNRQCKFLLLQYVFANLKAHRVEFKTDERNLQSRKAIENIGAKYEGMLREHTLMENGFRRNTFCYSILKSDWDSLKNTLNYAK